MSKTSAGLTFINLVVALVGLSLVLCPSKSYSQSQNLNLGPVDPGQILGELKSRHSTILSSEISARIKQITRREGYSFKKGEFFQSF